MSITTYYHGAHTSFELHEGQCFTTDFATALCYAGSTGVVAKVEISDALHMVDCEGYDHDTNDCPADYFAFRAAHAADGADVLRYSDEDEDGQELTCYRIISAAALADITVVDVLDSATAEDVWGY